MEYIKPINELIEEFEKFPTIGRKTAERLAFHLLSKDKYETQLLINAILNSTKNISVCPICGVYIQEDNCHICNSATRDHSTVCVVESSKDVFFFEKLRIYKGVYHVLGGVISPLDNIGPTDINISGLIERLNMGIKEVIIATNADLEGEATASYLSRIILQKNILVTRLAHGIPMGADIEFADEITLAKSLEARRQLK